MPLRCPRAAQQGPLHMPHMFSCTVLHSGVVSAAEGEWATDLSASPELSWRQCRLKRLAAHTASPSATGQLLPTHTAHLAPGTPPPRQGRAHIGQESRTCSRRGWRQRPHSPPPPEPRPARGCSHSRRCWCAPCRPPCQASCTRRPRQRRQSRCCRLQVRESGRYLKWEGDLKPGGM